MAALTPNISVNFSRWPMLKEALILYYTRCDQKIDVACLSVCLSVSLLVVYMYISVSTITTNIST